MGNFVTSQPVLPGVSPSRGTLQSHVTGQLLLSTQKRWKLPSLFLANVRSLTNKLDDLEAVVQLNNSEIIVCPMLWMGRIYMYVSLCVRHTFCQLAYRSELKRRGFTQGCAFWGSPAQWWIITFRGPNSPKPQFLGMNRHFKPNMRKIEIATSSDLCIRLTGNLTGSCGQQQKLRGWSRMVVKQFQDGGRPPFWKSIYRHNSAKNHPIFRKFCTQQQIVNWMNVTWSKWKSCIGHIPSSTERISCFFNGNLVV